MGETIGHIRPTALTAESWAPFGWLPVADTDPTDGNHRLAFEWDDVHVNLIGHDLSEVTAVPGGLRCEVLFRHLTHTQVVMPLDTTALLVVAPPGTDPASPAGRAAVAAFVIPVLSPVVLDQGTWHWGPYPVAERSVRLFNVQGLRYAEDNESIELTGSDAVEVLFE